jgi:tRNA pseudouridine38-40 synthase
MVRIMVGSLAEVGSGQRPVSWIAEALAAHDRRAAGTTAPPEGLTFVGVGYPDGSLQTWE